MYSLDLNHSVSSLAYLTLHKYSIRLHKYSKITSLQSFKLVVAIFIANLYAYGIVWLLRYRNNSDLRFSQIDGCRPLRRVYYNYLFVSRYFTVCQIVLLHVVGFMTTALSYLTWCFLIYYFRPFWFQICLRYIAVFFKYFILLYGKLDTCLYDKKMIFINPIALWNCIVCFCWWCVLFNGKDYFLVLECMIFGR